MNIFEIMTVWDYIIAVAGVLALLLGIAQLCTKRCIGILYIDSYTDESAGRFAVVSTVIYILGGILSVALPFAVNYINALNSDFSLPTALPRWIFIASLAALLIAQFSILKKKI